MQQQAIRAQYDADSITVYQAYPEAIALPAIAQQRFQAPFSFRRMTWIKPSYLWLMARSNWGTKANQTHILGLRISRRGWERALSLGVLTHPDTAIYDSGQAWEQAFEQAQVHIQWDPERTLKGAKLNERSIQVGISRFLIEEFNEAWIQSITDLTPLTRKINQLRKAGNYRAAKRLLPQERPYPLDTAIAERIGIR